MKRKKVHQLATAGLVSVMLGVGDQKVVALEATSLEKKEQKEKYVFFFIGDGFEDKEKLAELYLQNQIKDIDTYEEVEVVDVEALEITTAADSGSKGIQEVAETLERLVTESRELDLATTLTARNRMISTMLNSRIGSRDKSSMGSCIGQKKNRVLNDDREGFLVGRERRVATHIVPCGNQSVKDTYHFYPGCLGEALHSVSDYEETG